MTEPIFQNKIPQEKLILAIRQAGELGYPLYTKPGLLKKTVNIVAVSNEGLIDRYSQKHPCVKLAPGGVDTDFFSFKERAQNCPLRIGWAGSVRSWGKEFRGLDIIEDACDILGWRAYFVPALREDRLRTMDEMREYYLNDIDVYVDMSLTAGRQNGLLEAGSCGCRIISCRAGIAESLIQSGHNGYIVDRNKQSLADALYEIIYIPDNFSNAIRKTIEDKWSWSVQAPIFEDIFDECLKRRM
jgi:hypothetical protein